MTEGIGDVEGCSFGKSGKTCEGYRYGGAGKVPRMGIWRYGGAGKVARTGIWSREKLDLTKPK
jgi:hypothetical protein